MASIRGWQYSHLDGKLEDSLVFSETMPRPQPAELSRDELLIEVIAASLNPVDYKLPESGIIGRLIISRPAVPGLDFCGTIRAMGPNVTRSEIGQLIFGGLDRASRYGALSEQLVVSAKNATLLPTGIPPQVGAAIGTAATTAYQALLPGIAESGWKVFINGGSGGCGTWAIQFAKAGGMSVTTTCSTANVDFCKQLGADVVIDYRIEKVVDKLKNQGIKQDLVVDLIAADTFNLYSSSAAFLRTNGYYVQVGTGSTVTISEMSKIFKRSLTPAACTTNRINFVFIQQNNRAEYFEQIAHWLSEKKARAVIQETFPIEAVPEAFRKLRLGRTKGKIVVDMKSWCKEDEATMNELRYRV